MSSFLGYQLELIADFGRLDPFNYPIFQLTNTSALATIESFDLTIGDTAFNFDNARVNAQSSGTKVTLISPDRDGGGGVRSDILSFALGGFTPGSFVEGNTDIDRDNFNSDEDFRQVLFDLNGTDSSDNAVVTVTFDDGTVLSGQLPDFSQTSDEVYTFAQSDIDSSTVSLEKIDLDSIPLIQDSLFPEAVEYNPRTKRFLLSSQGEGTVFTTTKKKGKKGRVSPFVEDERLITTVGLEIDHQDNLLYIANSDVGLSRNSTPETAFQVAELAIADLSTKEIVKYVDLDDLRPGEPHFANDIALDGQGNAYVTDSLSPIIYKVDADGKPSILLEDEQFVGDGFNLNGIVYHPDDFLIVSDSNDGLLYKVPLDDPQQFTQIQLERSLANADGLLLADEDELIVVTNKFNEQNFNQVFNLQSEDNWESAQIVERLDVGDDAFTTAATIRDEEILVLDGQLDRLFTGEPTDEFAILTVGSIDSGAVSLEKIDLDSIPIIRESLFPEAVEYNPRTKRFLLSSQGEGTVFTTTKKKGKKVGYLPLWKMSA